MFLFYTFEKTTMGKKGNLGQKLVNMYYLIAHAYSTRWRHETMDELSKFITYTKVHM